MLAEHDRKTFHFEIYKVIIKPNTCCGLKNSTFFRKIVGGENAQEKGNAIIHPGK